MFEYYCKLVRVVDGDTVDIAVDLGFQVEVKKMRIRLRGIDTPEEGDPGYQEAIDHVTNWFSWSDRAIVQTVKDKNETDKKDSFGRYLGTFYPENGTWGMSLNDELIDRGLAKEYRR